MKAEIKMYKMSVDWVKRKIGAGQRQKQYTQTIGPDGESNIRASAAFNS